MSTRSASRRRFEAAKALAFECREYGEATKWSHRLLSRAPKPTVPQHIERRGFTGPVLAVLEVNKPSWRVRGRAQLELHLYNVTDRSIFLRLGNYPTFTDDGTVLAAAGLESVACGSRSAEAAAAEGQPPEAWASSHVNIPRAGEESLPGRERALYLPARQHASIELAGRVVSAAGLGAAIRFGGDSGDSAEVLLPLLQFAAADEACSQQDQLSERHQIRFRLPKASGVANDTGSAKEKALDLYLGAHPTPQHEWAWVGPHEPRWPLGSASYFFDEEVVSEPMTVTICSGSADDGKTAPSRKSPRRTLPAAAQHSPRQKRQPRQQRQQQNVRDQRLEQSAAEEMNAPQDELTGLDLPNTCRPCPKAIEARDAALVGLGAASSCHTARSKSARLPLLPGPEHATRWRGLGRQQDPLADPMLCEAAQALLELAQPKPSLVALCGDRLRSRSGRRLADSLAALGLATLAAPRLHELASWVEAHNEAIRPPGTGKEPTPGLVLAVDWVELGRCLSVLRGMPLQGAALLCSRSEEDRAVAVAGSLSCRWRVLPSLAL